MVNHQSERLSRVFQALSDPTRRAILAHLARGSAVSISDLAEPFAIKLPAVLKHLDVLESVGLIERSKEGRTVMVEIAARPLKTALDWLDGYSRLWESRLDRIARHAEKREQGSVERGK